jgi:hypothetical protein
MLTGSFAGLVSNERLLEWNWACIVHSKNQELYKIPCRIIEHLQEISQKH